MNKSVNTHILDANLYEYDNYRTYFQIRIPFLLTNARVILYRTIKGLIQHLNNNYPHIITNEEFRQRNVTKQKLYHNTITFYFHTHELIIRTKNRAR